MINRLDPSGVTYPPSVTADLRPPAKGFARDLKQSRRILANEIGDR